MNYVFIGLGNPGGKYEGSRHNVGFDALDLVASRNGVSFSKRLFKQYHEARVSLIPDKLFLIKPQTFMNRSGQVFPDLKRHTGAEFGQMVVVCDNMDLAPGQVKLKKGGGHAGHNGLKSIIAATGCKEFYRLYIGVGRPERAGQVVGHVLSAPEGEEKAAIVEALDRAARGIEEFCTKGPLKVMNELNSRKPS